MSDRPVYSLMGYALETNHEFATPMHHIDDEPSLEFIVGDPPWEVSPTDDHATWRSSTILDSGVSLESIHLIDEHRTLYRFGEVADFHLEPGRITAVLLDPAYTHMVEIRFLGPVIALARELSGHPVLHASAVVAAGGALGFLSGNGGGKTSIGATFLQRGVPLLTDDLLVLDPRPDPIHGFSGYPQMRMWPDNADNFVGSSEALERVHPTLEKRRVPVGPGGLGTFHAGAAPVCAIYELDRVPGEAFDLSITELTGADKLTTLVRHCFLGSSIHGIGLGSPRLVRLSDIAGRVPVRRLRYSGGIDDLDQLCETLDDLSSR